MAKETLPQPHLNKLTGRRWLNSHLDEPEFFYEGLTGMLNETIEAAEIELWT